ncbi:hypothetical protein [Micromonospora sp. WMMD964]|uniref:hypothetical protein n=1 Tax=Micromonospora sp. WMMD964 TaxID=3016091 RepID=UPI00249B3209|nr:hypothetical protein [Micromonospora sp. WMMD964]WFE99507.1 hypothetical protein O7616_21770 [Micromonospora sp. WMMD964]
MNETVLNVIGLMLVAISLCFSALQTREVARQSRINNGIGSATALVEVNNLIRSWHERLLQDPSARPYFFDGKPCAPDDAERPTVLIFAELLGDVLECNLQMASLLPAFDFAHSWHHWPAEMLRQSPILDEVVAGHPEWWPTLHLLQQQIRAGVPQAHPLLRRPPSRWRPSRSRGGAGVRLDRDALAGTVVPAGDEAAIPSQR